MCPKCARRLGALRSNLAAAEPRNITQTQSVQQLIDNQQKHLKNRAISESEIYCLHGFPLTEPEKAEGLGLARSSCPVCSQAPPATDKLALVIFIQKFLSDDWDEELAEENCEESRPEWRDVQVDSKGIVVTPHSTQRATKGRGTRIGRPGDWGPAIKYEPAKKIEQRDEAAVAAEFIGGRKVKPRGKAPDADE